MTLHSPGKTAFLTHRVILPAYMRTVGGRGELSAPPFSLDAFIADMDGAAGQPLVSPDIPRRVFLLWFQGLDVAPDEVKADHANWVAANPGWEVVLLDAATVGDWIDVSDLHPKLPMATQSDAIRLRLLSRHGGVWVDATTLCMRPLDDWLGRHTGQGFFTFGPASRTRQVASWFMAGRPGAPVLEAWRHSFEGYVRNRARRLAYYMFEYLTRTDPAFRATWSATPHLNGEGPHMLKRLLTAVKADVVTPARAALASVPLFKLSHRPGPESLERALPKLEEFGLQPAGLEAWT